MLGGPSTEEARAHLQERLVVLTKVLFWGLGAMALFSGHVIYELWPVIRPQHATPILAASLAGVSILGCTWIALSARSMSLPTLHAVDVCIASGAGVGLACSGYFASDLRAAGYTALVLAIFVVMTRAIIVQSTPRRTAVVSAVAFVPIIAAAFGLGLNYKQDVPGPIYIVAAVVLTVIATVLAVTGSGVMYGLRRQAEEAIQLGQYTLDRKIAEGGMGVVYRAHHVLLRRPTAIKLVAPDRASADTLDRFEREVQHTSQLTHPNTVAVFDFGRSLDGTFYYAMEYLDGLDLETLVRNYGPQVPGRVVHILAQVCGALQEAHDRGIIHRDIKPANIIVCERVASPDFAKVVDFGLVKEIAHDSTSTTQTILGTPAYLAPEAITSPGRLGPPADLYALGAVGYFLLSGRRVFEGANALDVCLKHVTATPAPLSASPDLAAVIMRCLAKEPEQRYETAADLARALTTADPGDWNDDRALLWWSKRDALLEGAIAQQRTETITVQPYLAPEAVVSTPVGAAADLYAVGAVGYFLLTGKCLFEGDSVAELCRQHRDVEPPASGVSADLDAVLLWCLAKAPSERPDSAATLARRLRAVRCDEAWDVESARNWWQEFRRNELHAVSTTGKTQITVDLSSREPAHRR